MNPEYQPQPPISQAPAPENGSLPQPQSIAVATPPEHLPPPVKQHKKWLPKAIAGLVVVVLIVSGLGIYVLVGGSGANCTPPKSSSYTKINAMNAYKGFVHAAQNKDEQCLVDLSSDALQTSKVVNDAQKFAELPKTLNSFNYSTTDYVSTDPSGPKGITLGYPLDDGSGNSVYLSFIEQGGKVLADRYEINKTDNTLNSNSPSAGDNSIIEQPIKSIE